MDSMEKSLAAIIVTIALIVGLAISFGVYKDNETSQVMAVSGYVQCPDNSSRGQWLWVKSGECPAYQVRGK